MKVIFSIALMLSAFVLSVVENNNQIKILFDTLFAHDKLMHCIGSQVLFIAFYAVFPNVKAVSLAILIFGVVIEIAQHFTGRGFSWGDLVADLVGVLICLLLKKL